MQFKHVPVVDLVPFWTSHTGNIDPLVACLNIQRPTAVTPTIMLDEYDLCSQVCTVARVPQLIDLSTSAW